MPPAQLALATILQAYTGASDAEAIEALIMDRRWQLVLDCIDCEEIKLTSGVAKERRISIEDDEMRHGRKSKSQRFDGYKRHWACCSTDGDSSLGVGST